VLAAALPGTTAAHQLVVSIRQKCTAEEALAVLQDLPNPRPDGDSEAVAAPGGSGQVAATASSGAFNPLKIDVFVQTLLNLGSKSFSHSFAAISKFHYVFKVTYQ